MKLFLPLLMVWMLLRPHTAMDAASAACRLFVFSVLPGLFPYMVLSLMLISRMVQPLSPWMITLLGWCGGSPTGGRLLRLCPDMAPRDRLRTAVMCATMSPMFLVGTLGGWLGSPRAGVCLLLAVLLGGWAAGLLAGLRTPPAAATVAPPPSLPLSFGESITSAAQTMLMVCGTMVMLRVFAALVTEATQARLPLLALPLTTLLEVTTGAQAMAELPLPLPLPLRTALMAGATGFGGAAVIMQNRAVYPKGMMRLPAQIFWQAVHGSVSFLLALGMMLL